MKYVRNQNMEFLDIDDANLAVYDNETGDTHYIDETGKSILKILESETEEENLINQLCEMYSTEPNEIIQDVRQFLDELIQKKVVICP